MNICKMNRDFWTCKSFWVPFFLTFMLCFLIDYLKGTWREKRETECRARDFRPRGAGGWVSTFYWWHCTRACLPRRWVLFIIKTWKLFSFIFFHPWYNCVILISGVLFCLTLRKWSQYAQRCLPLPGQSELSLQHHPGVPGVSGQLRHRESHGLERHHQDPQPTFQRVRTHFHPMLSKTKNIEQGRTFVGIPGIKSSQKCSMWKYKNVSKANTSPTQKPEPWLWNDLKVEGCFKDGAVQ